MSERDGEISETSSSSPSPSSCFLILAPKILLESLQIIFLRNKQTFLAIFAISTLPLSALHFAAAISTHRLRHRVTRLESLARLAATRFEARQVWKESREDAVSVLYSKALFALPCLALSLLAAVTAVSSAVNKRGATLRSAANAVKQAWKRPLVTAILVHALLLAYAHAPRTLAAMFPEAAPRLLILTVGSAVEIYLIAVMSLSIVVSIAEEKFGFDAIRVGLGVMDGRRLTGWVLSGFFAAATGLIAAVLERTMDGRDLIETPPGSVAAAAARVAVEIGDKFWLVVLYGFVVMWSYVVFTVFYCDCSSRKRLTSRGESEMMTVTV